MLNIALRVLALTGLCAPVLSSFVLLPLYIYPSPTAWAPVYDAVQNNPTVKFQIVVNPNSGPGAYPPDASYIDGVSKLNSYPNVLTIGYVATTYGQRPYANVKADIDAYAKWADYTAKNISIAGIFFDEVTTSADAGNTTYLRNAATYAGNQVPSDVTPVIFNPGVLAPTRWFSFADTVIEFENAYARYNGVNDATINTIPQGYRGQSAILVNQVPAINNMAAYVHAMVAKGIGGIYFTADALYADLSDLAACVSYVKAG